MKPNLYRNVHQNSSKHNPMTFYCNSNFLSIMKSRLNIRYQINKSNKKNMIIFRSDEKSFNKNELEFKKWNVGLARWLTPVIPVLWEVRAGRSPVVRSSRPAWPKWQNPVSTKNIKIRRAQWHAPVIPATWEAEAGELLEPGR